MSVHARSDLSAVTVSPTAHGGCGVTHIRPAPGGVPDKIWTLTCPACEDFLRSEPTWSSTLAELPETYDEQLAREDFDKRGARDRDQILALALAKLANVDLPESLLRPLTGNMPHTAAALTSGTDGATAALQARIAELEQALAEKAAEPPSAPPAAAPEPEPPAAVTVTPVVPPEPPSAAEAFSLPSNTKMRGMKREELETLARKAELDASGTRAELLERLIASKGNRS